MTAKRTVTYDGKTYKVRSDKAEIPDLDSLTRIGALVWLNQNTFRSGGGINTKRNPLAGMGEALTVIVR